MRVACICEINFTKLPESEENFYVNPHADNAKFIIRC